MKILCGTDFTPSADVAFEAAGALAARMGGTVRLVHVDESAASDADASTAASQRLRDAAGKAKTTVETAALHGHSDEVLVAEAERWGAELIVVGALGQRSASRWRLGSTADRVAQHSHCPVLVARNATAFAGAGPLRVVVGVDTSPPSDAALAWTVRLAKQVPCKLIGAHVYWPPEVRERLKLHGPIPIGQHHPEVDAAIEKEIASHLRAAGSGEIDLCITGGLGRIADHLVQIAEDQKADLIAVGSHQRSGLDRFWHGSISHGVIDGAPMNVICVPTR